MALIAANVEEGANYGTHTAAIFTRLKHLRSGGGREGGEVSRPPARSPGRQAALSHFCNNFVTELIHENETKSGFGKENLRADNPTLVERNTFDSQ
jgi:hypothetical protein